MCDRDEKIVPLFWTLNRLFSDEEYKSSKIVTAAHVSGMFTKVLHFEIQNRDSLIAGLKTPCSRLVTEGQYLNQFLELIASLTNLKLLPRTLPMSLSDVNEVWAQPHERIMAAVLSIK